MGSVTILSESPILQNQINELVVTVDISGEVGNINAFEYITIMLELYIPVVNDEGNSILHYCLSKEYKVSELEGVNELSLSIIYPGIYQEEQEIAGVATIFGYDKLLAL